MNYLVLGTLAATGIIGLTIMVRRLYFKLWPKAPWPRPFPRGCKY